MTKRPLFIALACALAIAGFVPSLHADNHDQAKEQPGDLAAESKQLVLDAAAAVSNLRERERFSNILPQARALAIFPQVVKGGLIIAAQTGIGVLVVRQPDGFWSAPAFYSIGALSIGLQAGAEVSTIGLVVMSDKALNAFYEGGFELGSGIDLTVATLGGTAALDTSADIVTFTAASGAFAGISLEGSKFTAERPRNEAYYGRMMTTQEVVSNPTLSTPESDTLAAALANK